MSNDVMLRPMKHLLKVVCGMLCGITLLAQAVTVEAQPDAGILLQEQRQPGAALPDRLPDRDREVTAAPPTDSGVKVLIRGFRFTGGQAVATEAELQDLVRGSIGRELGFSDLLQVAARVTDYLREKKGFLLARAYLPEQEITAGVVEIVIIVGHIDGKVRIRIREPFRIEPSLLAAIADRALPDQSPVRMERIERAVLLMKDLPGIEAHAALEPGATPGSTRIVIDAAEGPAVQGALTGDNYGDRYTGAYRGGGQIAAYDPSGFGDQLTFAYTAAERLHNWRASYAVPLGATGLTWHAAYTGLIYELGKDLTDLQARGRADTVNTGVDYPLVRTRRASVWTGVGFEYLMLADEAGGIRTKDRKLPLGTASLSGSVYDRFGGGGLTSALLVLTGGKVNLSALAFNKAVDDAGPRTSGDFMRGTYFVARLQRLTRQVALFGSLRGQLASGNLDSSQKFILGGPTGVRAYPTGEAPGDEGHAVTVETRYDLSFMPSWAATQLIGFFDAGWVKLHRDPWPGAVVSATGRNDYLLSGGGVGIHAGKAGLYSIRASYAHKIGPNDGRNASGNDADNLSDGGRFWLQLVVWL